MAALNVAEGNQPTLVARFRAELARLVPGGGRIGLAVSGGADSLALLLLAEAAIPGRFEVASVDHGLRPQAAAECAMVARICSGRQISCAILAVLPEPGNLQHQARRARYRALGQWAIARGLAAIATAHHADDQAETVLMRLNRGSGVAGLAGVRACSHLPFMAVPAVRPLLDFRRAELAGLVAAAGIAPAQDPGNDDPRFDRVRLRQALAQCDWIDPPALARSARHLGEAYEAIEAYASALWPEHVRAFKAGYLLRPCHLREMNRRLLAGVMEQLGGRARGGDVARLLCRLESGVGGNLAGLLASVEQGEWYVRREPPRRPG